MSTEILKQIKSELKTLTKDLESLLQVELKTVKDIKAFEDKLIKSVSGDSFGQAFEDWKSRTLKVFSQLQEERSREFGRYVAEFIRAQQSAGVPTREFQDAWRVGPIKMALKSDQASVQFSYNDQVVTRWVSVSSSEDIEKNYQLTLKQLEDNALSEDGLGELFEEAFCMARLRGQQKSSYNSMQFPIKEYFLEVEIALFRLNKQFKGKYKIKELPLWAFLYNLDRYRRIARQIPVEKRLNFESGSQSEIHKGMGLMLNGLDALDDYKTFCYVRKG